jgi:benzoylformate decarboxylase
VLKPDFAAIRERLQNAEALVLVGGRAFVAYPYRDVRPIPEGVKVLHVADNPEAFGREHPADVALLGDIGATLQTSATLLSALLDRARVEERMAKRADAKLSHVAAVRAEILGGKLELPLSPDAAVLTVSDALPANTLLANDSAATFGKVQELLMTRPGRYFFARGGVLGCNMPAAVGASLLHDGPVASFVGDGGAMYSPQALWSAARYRAKVLFFVFNNRRYGVLQNIAKQLGCKNAVAGRFVGMDVDDPAIDFMALASSMGVPAVRADAPDAIRAAIAEALRRDGPTLIEIAVK